MTRTTTFGTTALLTAFLVVAAPWPAAAGGLSFVETEGSGTEGLAVSPDGMNVYASRGTRDLLVHTRNPTTGELTLLQTLEDEIGGDNGFARGNSVAVSPDGDCVYVATSFYDKVAAFSRSNVDGTLTFVSVEEDGVGGVMDLGSPEDVLVSPDGLHVYVTAEENVPGADRPSVVAFARTPPACGLTYVETEFGDAAGFGSSGPADGFTIAPDGEHLFVGGRFEVDDQNRGSVNVLGRNAITGALAFAQRFVDGISAEELSSRVRAIAVSPDDENVYAVSSGDNSIVTFNRNPGSSNLLFLEAHRDGGLIDGMQDPRAVVVSPDGAYVYVTTAEDDAVVVFRRDTTTGMLRYLEVHKDPDIDPPNAIITGTEVVVSPDGRHLYVGGSRIVVFAVDTCGNGARGVDEQCDDGNVIGGDGCSATCRLELCGALPTAGCRGTAPLGASLQIRNLPPDESAKDQLQWKWSQGEATTIAELGDPTTSATYVLCVYDGSANVQPLLSSAAPAGGLCRKDAPCWKAKPTAYQYKDGLFTPDGLQQIKLSEGLVNGKARMQFKGKGINLAPPALPLTLPVTVQVKNTDTGVCWEATYTTASTNDGTQFKAKGD